MLKKTRIMIFFCMFFLFAGARELTAYAETKEVEIINFDGQGDLTVMFTFDKENVDITFVSPSGQEVSSGNDNVEMAQGDLWATYRIKNAEQGVWSVKYDLKSNEEITYSVIEDGYGLWIQYLNVEKGTGDEYVLKFQADFNEVDTYYSYEIYAVNTSDVDEISKLTSGSAKANTEEVITINLGQLESGEYAIRIDVFYNDGGAELFDSMLSETIQYDNPNELDAIGDYKVKIDLYGHVCLIDWSESSNWNYESYKLVVLADGEIISSSELEGGTTVSSTLFPDGCKNIEVKLAYKEYGIWSRYNIKSIDLEQEFITNKTAEVTNSSQLELQYKVEDERLLYAVINEIEGNYTIKGEGSLFFDLQNESNEIYIELELDNQIYFIVDTDVYYDSVPPSIILFEDLDGKTINSDKITILGKVVGGNGLTINDNSVELDDSGAFSFETDLSQGENLFEIVSKDVNGNEASRILTLYRNADIFIADNSDRGWIEYLPFVASGLTSLLIIILSVAFMRKREKSADKRNMHIFPLVAWDILIALADGVFIWQFIERYTFNNSIQYLELAEKSVSQAVRYIKFERMFGLAALVCLIIFAISIALTILIAKKNKKSKGGF